MRAVKTGVMQTPLPWGDETQPGTALGSDTRESGDVKCRSRRWGRASGGKTTKRRHPGRGTHVELTQGPCWRWGWVTRCQGWEIPPKLTEWIWANEGHIQRPIVD